MNIFFLLYIVLVASEFCFSKPYYNGPGYSNERDTENSHQKKRLLSEEPAQMQEASSLYEPTGRYRKYQPSEYMRRDSRLDHDQTEFEGDSKDRREYYDNNAEGKDSSIEVILDPRAKKAVAVVEKSPSGQAMYDLSGWKNSQENENNEQVVNLVYPAERAANEKLQRKYNENFEATNGGDYSNEQMTKKKRNAELTKPETKEKRKIETATDKLNECPPHNNPQSSSDTKNLQEIKREVAHWSQEQITALHNSIQKANQDSAEMNNLRAILSEMGIVDNTEKRSISEKENENDKGEIIEAKREASNSEFNEDEANQDQDSNKALTDDEKWELDVNSAPQEPLEKRTAEEKESLDKKSNDLDLDLLNRKKRQSSDKKELSASNDAKIIKRDLEETKKEKRKVDDSSNYDKQMENQIQAKIDAIKEKVKRDLIEDQKRGRVKREGNEKSSSSKSSSRKKRANIIQEKQMIYRPFQADQDEETELDGDFDDNKLYLQKRQAAEDDWQYFDSRGREYYPYLQSYYPQARNRRSYENDYVEDNVPFHDGGMMSNRLIRNREKLRDPSFADQDTFNANTDDVNDSEYFGSLPLSYNGEVTRYKRVKRDNPYK